MLCHFLYYLDLNVGELSSAVIGSWNSHKQPWRQLAGLWIATIKSVSIFCLQSFCLVLSHSYLLERFAFVGCCYTSTLASQFSLIICSFCLLFLFSFSWCIFWLFSPSPIISLSLFYFESSFLPILPNYRDTNFSSNHFSSS